MTTEKKEVTREQVELNSKIATCHICTLADFMKQCEKCPFCVGLLEPVKVLTN